MKLVEEALDIDTMAKYSLIASDVRKQQLQQAHAISQHEPISENMDPRRTEKLSLQLYRQSHWFNREESKPDHLAAEEKFYVGTASKRYTCSKLTLDERVEIIHDAVVNMLQFADIACKYNVKTSLISYLVGQVRRDPGQLQKMMHDKQVQQQHQEKIM